MSAHQLLPSGHTLVGRARTLLGRPLLAYVKSIQGTRDLAQVAWNFINDSLRTTICLQAAEGRCLVGRAGLRAKRRLLLGMRARREEAARTLVGNQ